jgi:hypothetical protein
MKELSRRKHGDPAKKIMKFQKKKNVTKLGDPAQLNSPKTEI